MSDTENFLARWSRLKRESGVAESHVDEKPPTDALPAAAVPAPDLPSPPAFDPASLPPIESIVADSDIRPFLQACVPEELTRAALRNTWTADPAIRDFIGIADNQWDFNEPGAMPGFGPIGAVKYAWNLLARAVVNINDDVAEQPLSENADPVRNESADVVLQISEAPANASAEIDPAGELVPQNISESNPAVRATRLHGSALPK
jgi:hypothetical protein